MAVLRFFYECCLFPNGGPKRQSDLARKQRLRKWPHKSCQSPPEDGRGFNEDVFADALSRASGKAVKLSGGLPSSSALQRGGGRGSFYDMYALVRCLFALNNWLDS